MSSFFGVDKILISAQGYFILVHESFKRAFFTIILDKILIYSEKMAFVIFAILTMKLLKLVSALQNLGLLKRKGRIFVFSAVVTFTVAGHSEKVASSIQND